MSELQNKYKNVISAAQTAGINNLQVKEQDGILYIAGDALNSKSKDQVWDALGTIDPKYTASDINLDIKISQLSAGTELTVNTESTNLNIRKTPSTDGEIVGKAKKGEKVSLVEQTNDEWWLIKTAEGKQGYAYSRYLKV